MKNEVQITLHNYILDVPLFLLQQNRKMIYRTQGGAYVRYDQSVPPQRVTLNVGPSKAANSQGFPYNSHLAPSPVLIHSQTTKMATQPPVVKYVSSDFGKNPYVAKEQQQEHVKPQSKQNDQPSQSSWFKKILLGGLIFILICGGIVGALFILHKPQELKQINPNLEDGIQGPVQKVSGLTSEVEPIQQKGIIQQPFTPMKLSQEQLKKIESQKGQQLVFEQTQNIKKPEPVTTPIETVTYNPVVTPHVQPTQIKLSDVPVTTVEKTLKK